ncbi:glycoside hydrolase family 79 protein [Colletotrichum tofieldiae]|uniref:Glycoside hydrolase family 79 protein n=1 Tax=Colletotrichum tofieldiae TaxID=708197 RepID=A0A166U188_9PEZI|nr:glycoside hydrolase family 79 protein [Colletotrichum tofieldiae]GKT64096.1 glycoside hydrolase family 79 protein [Colletotrichum tofieldiae]GKT71936.1 glycoside hydrolase family 79 protein [Colletotrichum tofieldiae]
MAPLQSRLLVGCGLISAALAADNVLSLTIPEDVPNNVSAIIDPSFAGFGIELDHLYYFMGDETPNDLSINLLNNLANFTGRPPYVRLGGNTQDYVIYDESQDEWLIKANPRPAASGNVPADNFIIGPRFMEIANRMPKGTPITWGLNMGYAESDYLDQLTTMASQIIDRCTNLNLMSFEFGNEPDLYGNNGFRTESSWSGSEYVKEWRERADAVWEEVLEPRGLHSNFFEASASTAWVAGTGFEIKDLVGYGIDDKANNSDVGYITSWNQHNYYYFVGSFPYPLTLDYMMRFDTTKAQFDSAIEAQITQAEQTTHPFALREMSVVGPLGVEGLSDTFASALWTLNFLFYAATINISSVQFHMTFDSNASAWQPTAMFGRDRFVRPLYYGMAAFSQTIGRSCTARVAQAEISDYPSDHNEYIKAWSVYQGDSLASLVVLNGKVANVSEADKGSITVDVTLPTSLAGETLHLSYLTSDGADATSGTTWNGISFEQGNDGKLTQVSNEDVTVKVGSDGKASIPVRDSEAVVANIGGKVGSGEPDSTACNTLATSSQGVGSATSSTPGSSGDPSNSSSDNGNDDDSGAAGLASGKGIYTCIAWSLAVSIGAFYL